MGEKSAAEFVASASVISGEEIVTSSVVDGKESSFDVVAAVDDSETTQ